eukprot:516404-Pyramimonas_sp.AAC.1
MQMMRYDDPDVQRDTGEMIGDAGFGVPRIGLPHVFPASSSSTSASGEIGPPSSESLAAGR